MKTTLLTPETDENAVKTAAELIRAGEVVGMPTETVYGLAANALNGIVHGFHGFSDLGRHLFIGVAVQIQCENPCFKRGQRIL